MNEETATGLKPHPLAELLPLLQGEEFEALVADIKANGLLEPITTYQDMVLDGRTRDRACGVAGIVPVTREFAGPGSPAAFVLAKNIHRRHLDESQRALIGAKLRKVFEEEAKANMSRGGQGLADMPKLHSRDRAAQAVNVSSRLVGSAEKVLKDGVPELAEAVKQGEVKVSTAAELAELPPGEQAQVVAKGPKAVRTKATDIRRDKKAKKPQVSPSEPPTGGNAGPATDSRTAADKGHLPDEQWLEVLPLRSKLRGKSRAQFDREALHWRDVDSLIERIRSSDPGFVDEARDRLTHYATPLLTHTFLHVLHPWSWQLCHMCRDKRAGRSDEVCPYCRNVRFRVTRVDDPFEQSIDTEVDPVPAEAQIERGSESRPDSGRPRGASEPRKGKRSKAATRTSTGTPTETTEATNKSAKGEQTQRAAKAAGKPSTGEPSEDPKATKRPAGGAKARGQSRRRVSHQP